MAAKTGSGIWMLRKQKIWNYKTMLKRFWKNDRMLCMWGGEWGGGWQCKMQQFCLRLPNVNIV